MFGRVLEYYNNAGAGAGGSLDKFARSIGLSALDLRDAIKQLARSDREVRRTVNQLNSRVGTALF